MDPEISVAHIGKEFSISTREVHRQFAHKEDMSTFLDTLRSIRLAAAVRMLKDPGFAHISVSEIGYRAGFIDSAYFGRVFRKKMNCSPGIFSKLHQKL
ncbi:helix-turn-helix transcriptional regulator [Glaciimonas sp. GG7]